MNIDIPQISFESFKTIIKYQKILLLKRNFQRKGWKLSELKKEYLKDEDVSSLIKKYNKKKKKEIKKSKVNEPENVVEATENVVEEPENVVEATENVVEATENVLGKQIEIPNQIKKKRKLRRIR